MEGEVFEAFGFLFDFHVVKVRKVRSTTTIFGFCFKVSQFFGVDQLHSFSPNVVKYNRLCFIVLFVILKAKDPHLSEVNELSPTVRTLLMHLNIFRVVIEGKADLTNGGRLLILGCIDNEVPVGCVSIELSVQPTIFAGGEVDVWFNLSDCSNVIADCVYAFFCPHFSELAFGVTLEVKV